MASAAAAGGGSGLGALGKSAELRSRLLFVLMALVIFRIGAHITIPGIDPQVMETLFQQQQGSILEMFNMFSGGALQRMSVFALGVMPYITASIIMQLMSHVVPSLEQIRKEGESGRRKITKYTRYLTLALCTFQALGIGIALEGQQIGGQELVYTPGPAFLFTTVVTLATGTMFLMWLGEQVTERGIGNGISILIFAGIVSGLPSALGNTLELVRTGELSSAVVLFIVMLAGAVTAFVVFCERGQRRITVNYARRQQGRKMYAAQQSHLPLKLNMAGVIPAIFASSIILFPTTIGSMVGQTGEGMWLLRELVQTLQPGQPLYIMFYGAAIIFFCFFYTSLVFDSRDTAENLKKAGAYIPGIRPGEQTARYIDGVLTRLTLVGALYVTAVCLMPEFLIVWLNVPFYFGGTSLLIIVIVVMDFMSQIQSHMMSHQYGSLMRKANLKGYGRRSGG
jgi:preprotein translocase subunit SecY